MSRQKRILNITEYSSNNEIKTNKFKFNTNQQTLLDKLINISVNNIFLSYK